MLIQAYNQDYYGTLQCLKLNKIRSKKNIRVKNNADLATKSGNINLYNFFL